MSTNLVVVALPADDDRVWKISSEKKPHLTLLFLGDAESNPNVDRIVQFVEHAVSVCEHGEFYLDVDYRDVLGEDKADVLHFRKDWSFNWINQFRNQLLQNDDIRKAYESVEQFPEWRPHLTLGYPEAPANEDKIPDHGFGMVRFDRIAVWTGNFEGPSFRLEWPERNIAEVAWSGAKVVDELLHRKTDVSEEVETVSDEQTGQTAVHGEVFVEGLMHYGIKGMRWGVRKTSPPMPVAPTATSKVPHGTKRKTKIETDGGQNHPASEDAIKVAQARAKLSKSGPAALSNHELREVATRLQLEQQVVQMTRPAAKKFIREFLIGQGKQGANVAVGSRIQKKVRVV